MESKPIISIVFLTYNGMGDYFKETLKAVLDQKTDREVEIIAIDSGSDDGTVEFIKNHPQVKLHTIPKSEFGHGKTRQLGATLAAGDFIIYLTQDATPANEMWLENLIKNFSDPDIVGVCGRIVPRKNACLLKKIEVDNDLSGRKNRIIAQIKNKADFDRLSFYEKRVNYYFFNDVSSAIRRNYIIENPLPEVGFAEDVEFAKKALDNGERIVFEPDSVVYHSHDYTIAKTYKRNFTDSKYHKEHLAIKNVPTIKHAIGNTFKQVARDICQIKNYHPSFFSKLSSILYSPIIHFAEQIGQYRGTKKNKI